MAGLEKPSQGRIVIGNSAVYNGSARSEIPAEERNLGLVFQSYALWPHKTVFENVAYPLKLRKIASAEITQRVQAVLDQLGLGHWPSAIRISFPAASSSAWRLGVRWSQPAGDPAGRAAVQP